MGVVVRLVIFLVGALGMALVGFDTAQDHFGVNSAGLLNMMGETPGGVANSMLGAADGGLNQLGAMLAGLMGGDAESGQAGLVQSWGPQSISALVSALLVFFSARR
jgi:hypothetical protein